LEGFGGPFQKCLKRLTSVGFFLFFFSESSLKVHQPKFRERNGLKKTHIPKLKECPDQLLVVAAAAISQLPASAAASTYE
jgi:hypothetical protein